MSSKPDETIITTANIPVIFEYINENLRKYYEPLRQEIKGLQEENRQLRRELAELQNNR